MFAPLQAQPCLGSPSWRISRECDIDTKQAAGENVRVIHVVLDHVYVRTLTIAASLIFQKFRFSAALSNASRICVCEVTIRDAKSGKGAAAAGSGAYAMSVWL